MSNSWVRKSFLLSACIILSFVTGCVTSGGGGWPIETYNFTCNTGMMPTQPVCLTVAVYNSGFKYTEEFHACKESMLNFTNALDTYYQCSDMQLKTIFDKLVKDVPETYNCYVNFFANANTGDSSSGCPPVDVPRFYQSYEAEGIEINLGVPRCIVKSEGYNFAPKSAYQLDDCRQQVDVFIGKSTFFHSLDAASAHNQYYTYLVNLRQIIDRKTEEAVSKFNCLAEGRRYCY